MHRPTFARGLLAGALAALLLSSDLLSLAAVPLVDVLQPLHTVSR